MAATENVTVLFTDLVGSTELASALSPEAGDEVRRKHFSALRQTIATNGGTEVKNLGDGLMVVFPAASAALACAVAMQQAVHRDNIGADRRLGIRIGLSAGEATQEDGDYFGDPVVEAARLCARAEGGQILAAEVVRMLGGRRSSHTFTSLGTLELKGLPEPIETLAVTWEPLAEEDAISSGRVPLPVRLAHRPGIGLVGRDEELASLSAAAKRVATGEGREVVLIAGEPGQGKTTLVSEIARRAHEDGTTVLLGRCDEEEGAPYRPFHEVFTHYVAHADEDLLRSHVAVHGGVLGRLVPALQQRVGELPAPQSSDLDTERYLLYAAAVGLLEQEADRAPVLLVLDDLHWVDKPSLQLLRHVVANTFADRILILGTYRDGELSVSHPLTDALGSLIREPGVSSTHLKGFDDTGVVAFMESAAGHELDEASLGLAHQVYRETDGNPFFVAEVLRHLSESGAIYQDATTGRWAAKEAEGQLALPQSVRTVIGTRVSRLGGEAARVLSTASVIGRDFDLDLLVEATDIDEDGLLDLLERAQHATVIADLPETPGRYSFSHALIQQTLYEDLAVNRRTRLHRAVGEAIERLYGAGNEERVGELARHFLLATRPTDVTKAISYAQRAGNSALEALAPDDAVRYFSRALELVADKTEAEPSLRIDLLVGLGTAQRHAGIPDFRETLLEAARLARHIDATEALVAAVLANNRGFFSALGVIDTERVEMLEAALASLPDTDSPSRAKVLARLCSELAFGPLERRLALARQSKAMARRFDDATIVQVLFDCGAPLRIPDMINDQLEEWHEALQLADRLDDLVMRLWARAQAVTEESRTGQFDLARHHMTQLTELARKLQQPIWLWFSTYLRAAESMLQGDTTTAEKLASDALEIGMASGQPDAMTFYGTQLMLIRLQQGRLGELVPLIADVADQNPGVPTFRAVLAAAHLQAGDTATARQLVDAASVESFAIPMDTTWLDGMVMYARPTIELGITSAAEQLLELLAPYHAQVPHNALVPQEPVAMFLGGLATVVGRYDDAETYFAEADDLNRRGEMRYAEAQTALLWGAMLLQRGGPGDAERARQLLVQARESAAAHGYARIELRAEAHLSELNEHDR